ncbi:MAG: response regulator [Planctomycetota bacterium]|nr:MAG: response regulator [Planctomycetota bacterium]REJ98585.1 MAG: response regulator [Planctomycetota bacterium]REK29885.1 MAG: response regulator [Planctomycetota bacterium]REK47945.1 MAG: response regulator [Planctomycetota bacterium]
MHDEVPHILFVEDDPLLSEVTAFRLELLGYRVETVGSGEDALAAVEKQKPNVAIVDLVLPGMSGIDLIDRFASNEATSDVAVMALSIEADTDAVQRAYNAGAQDYLVAPYDPATLEAKVERLLDRQSTDKR